MDEMIYIHKIYKKNYILCNNLYVSLKILISVFFFFWGQEILRSFFVAIEITCFLFNLIVNYRSIEA